jgi:predicted Rdx family selenoprotein
LRSVLNDRKIWKRKNELETRAKYLGLTQHTPEQTGILRSVLNGRKIWTREKDSPIGVGE